MNSQIEVDFIDPVICGYNREWMKIKYEEARKKPDKYLLATMNIKNFRYFNCLYGHEGGNEILKLIYHKIAEFLVEGESISHDFSDNFLILFTYTDINDFLHVRMRKLIDVCYRIDDSRIYRNNFESYGIYPLNHHDCDFDEAYHLANIARKQSETLTNRSHCYELYDDTYSEKYMSQRDLEYKTAQAFLNYEFVPYLQPKIDPHTNKIIGAESLIRWINADGKFIPVSDFLPILIENTYIYVVDLDIFDVVCKMLDERIRQNKPVVPISFNISKPEFYDDDFINDYLHVAKKYSIPLNLIEFELMESISLDDTTRLKKIIKEIKDAGFSCSLDDFGNGFSSFNVLLNAAFDTIKMDREFFVRNLNEENKVIIKTMIDLIKSLHMKVVAEGVETKEYVDFLLQCGCDAIQGFYYHKPMSMTDFNILLDNVSD
ncbi:EAL domain-containing protein [Anaerorhabdus sp.]|nr:EAL domain-containing protein [Anaerorhabdus sp.]MEA4874695.1 EAL domain-containing protein [Anaerorhabdus sp.]